MNIEKLIDKINEAREYLNSIGDLEDEYKPIVFEIILKQLYYNELDYPKSTKDKSEEKKQFEVNFDEYDYADEILDEMTSFVLDNLRRTEHANIFGLKSGKDKALYVLMASKDLVVGLTPPQIFDILDKKFQIKNVTKETIAMGLKNAVKYVERKEVSIKSGITHLYFIVDEGITFLTSKISKSSSKEKD